MIEEYLQKLTEDFSKIVLSFDNVEIVQEENIWKIKARFQIFDGTFLWIREIRGKNKIHSYSYYWLREDNSLIIGWDNAPHHSDIKTYPHHKHLQKGIESSYEKNLKEVLTFIQKFLLI